MDYVLKTNNLCKYYRNFKALNGLKMNVPKGSIYGFVGKNGAGKTTLIRLLCGLQMPTDGDFELYGVKNTDKKISESRSRIGAIVESPSLFPEMTAEENLKYQYRLLGIPDYKGIPELLELVGLADTGKKKAGNFSLGMRQRLGIAIALCGNQDLLILDEPINGLDPQGIIEIRELILKLNHDRNNEQLDELHNERLQYHHGNIELKNAITNISHDIRTPLTAIYGYLDMLQKTDNPEKQQHYISVMKERTELMKQLTEELFRYSAIISDESDMDKEDVFVNQVLAESVSSFYPALSEKRIEPNILITEKRIVKNINRAALTRVFSNLLSNAVKYSDGDLEIKLDDSGEITFSNSAGGLSAVDTEQLFDRFYTFESAHNSTGLGLSIARTLTERMGGTIEAEYRDNRLIIKIKLV